MSARWAPAGRTLAVILLVLLAGLTGSWHWSHGPERGADDHGQYLLHARSLTEGRPYTDIGFLHSRHTVMTAPIAEPPALPALIAAVFSTQNSEELAGVRILLGVFLTAFACLSHRYFHDNSPQGAIVAAIAAAWTIVALARLHVLDTVLADLPFCAAMWLAFVVADASGHWTVPRIALFALAGALAFSFRMAALPLLPAIATFILVRPAADRPRLAIAAVAWAFAAYLVMFQLPSAAVLAGESSRSLQQLGRDIALNVTTLFNGIRLWIPLNLPWRPANLFFHAAIASIAALGAVVEFRTSWKRFAHITIAWYLLMLVVLPTRSARYLWPMYPFLAVAFLTGLRTLLKPLLAGANVLTPAFATAAVLLLAGAAQDALKPNPASLDRDAAAESVFAFMRAERSRESVVRAMFFSPRVLTWKTRVPAMPLTAVPDEELLAELSSNKITHVITGDPGGETLVGEAHSKAVARHPDRFRPVHSASPFAVYRFIPEARTNDRLQLESTRLTGASIE